MLWIEVMGISNKSKPLEQIIRERLKESRIEAGFTSAKIFSDKKGLKVSTYALHESGMRDMSLRIIEKYANLLNLEQNWLLTGLGSKYKS